MKMTPELFKTYNENPLQMDAQIRAKFNIPDNRFYAVSVWPDEGTVRIDNNRFRDIPKTKISKIDQKI